MNLGSIGQNGANEFFETMLYMTAYTEAQTQIKNFTKDIESPVLQDALQSMMSVMTMGLLSHMLRMQDDFIEKIFKVAEGLVVILLGSSYAQKLKSKFVGKMGFKLMKKLDFLKSSFADRVATAQLVIDGASNHIHAERTSQSETSTLTGVTSIKNHMVNKESLNHSVGSGMASRYNETLLFKLFTKSFTPNDEVVIKKILGKDSSANLKSEDLNKVADFLFVTDSNGNITGLSEQLFSLINGLGYLHNKN